MNQIGSVLNLGLGLILLWSLYYFGWRRYRIDKVRNRFFELRNELFIYASDGNVDFDNFAYASLRSRLNALIRYAHIIGLTRSVVFAVQQQFGPIPSVEQKQEQYSSALAELSPESRAKLTDIHNRMHAIMVNQIFSGAPIIWPLILVVAPVVIYQLRKKSTEEKKLKLASDLKVDMIEERAVIAWSRGSHAPITSMMA